MRTDPSESLRTTGESKEADAHQACTHEELPDLMKNVGVARQLPGEVVSTDTCLDMNPAFCLDNL